MFDYIWNLRFLSVSNSDTGLAASLKLLCGMLLAANLSAIAIYLCIVLFNGFGWIDYETCFAGFIVVTVLRYMYAPGQELTPEYVHILSRNRFKWGSAASIVILTFKVLSLAVLFLVGLVT